MNNLDTFDYEIAIVGMAGRFPGAKNVDEFWQNLQNGVESISFFSDQEVVSSSIDPHLLNNPNYVKAHGVLEDIELFDASFFGFSPREAETLDPQHRLFLECAWEALESAGYNSETYEGRIGVYAGVSASSYLDRLHSNRDLLEPLGSFQLMLNERDFLSTRVSYKLNLKGPSITVQTACSTSLAATHLACQSLLSGESDMALAGGVSIRAAQKTGYFYQEGGVTSPDGHCRAFDARAQGTVGGSGVGVVVLKRMADALADGDCIHAIIKGSAINNDGSLKIGYMAPSVDGQAEVIAEALAITGIEPETVTYIETHGTGTPLGDPIEIAALTQAFRARTEKRGFCAIGSVKTNIGHLDAAAGVVGLIKTVLALKYQLLPPSLHFEQPNPKIDFANSPFYVNATLSEWKVAGFPRRAGVSSFGIGGTNVHVILEEAPPREPSEESRAQQLLVLSAKTSSALEIATDNLVAYLKQHSELNLADVAYTLQVGRQVFNHRRMLVCYDQDNAVAVLETRDPQRMFTAFQESTDRTVVFMFPGGGAQYVNMGFELYQDEATFREQVDLCSELLKPHLGVDLRNVLYPSKEQAEVATQQLKQTSLALPALFVTEYALAKLWMSRGVHPQAMIGHSLGEYVAACLAGVFSLQDALALVALRGRLFEQLPKGAMLSVPLSAKELQPFLDQKLSLAAINAPSLCVVSGHTDAIGEMEKLLSERGVEARRVQIDVAAHSEMVTPILETFTRFIEKLHLQVPRIPYVSNVTGTWITAAEATDPSYWARHLRQTVRFAEGVHELLQEQDRILLEVGPGHTLSILARQQIGSTRRHATFTSLRHPHDQKPESAFLLNTLGQLWLAGAHVDWWGFHAHKLGQRVPLPTYPFERQRYWIEPRQQTYKVSNRQTESGKKPNTADWFYIPSWKRSVPPEPFEQGDQMEQESCWLVFADACGLGSQMVKRLEQRGQNVVTVTVGKQFSRISDGTYTLNPCEHDDYVTLFKELRALDTFPSRVVHLWSITPNDQALSGIERFEESQYLGFCSLLFLSQALDNQNRVGSLDVVVVSNNVQEVTGEEALRPEKATVLGPCKVIPQEYPNITCRAIDIVLPKPGTWQEEKLIDSLVTELVTRSPDQVIAYRGNHRWIQNFENVCPNGAMAGTTRLREGGVYLVIGGLEEIGFVLTEYLAQTVRAKLIILEHAGFPARDEWGKGLATHNDVSGVSRAIRHMQALEEVGAEVLVVNADVTNQEQMQAIINQTDERFGKIQGIIHTAGLVGDAFFSTMRETSPTECEQHLQSKMHELFVLEQVLQGRKLDFCQLSSSLSSVFGGVGRVVDSAANLLVDAFIRQHNQTHPVSWISANWDAWQLKEEKEQRTGLETALPELVITPKEITEAFQHLLSMGTATQFVVSAGDLRTRVDQWIKHEPLRETEHAGKVESTSPHSRPDLQNSYVAPSNEIERTIAVVWQELLGIDQLGIHDNFFELGGHSLMAAQLVSRLREAFSMEVPLRSIFEKPTIAGLAEVVEEMFLEKMEALSEEEAQRLLSGVFHHNG